MALDLLWARLASWKKSDQAEECSLGGSFLRKTCRSCLALPKLASEVTRSPFCCILLFTANIRGRLQLKQRRWTRTHINVGDLIHQLGREEIFQDKLLYPPFVFFYLFRQIMEKKNVIKNTAGTFRSATHGFKACIYHLPNPILFIKILQGYCENYRIFDNMGTNRFFCKIGN